MTVVLDCIARLLELKGVRMIFFTFLSLLWLFSITVISLILGVLMIFKKNYHYTELASGTIGIVTEDLMEIWREESNSQYKYQKG